MAQAQSSPLTVIYVNATSGNDDRDGLSEATAVKTIDTANSKLKSTAQGGTMDNNIIVVAGTFTNPFRSKGGNPATITGKWNDVTYNAVIKLSKPSGEGSTNPGDGLSKTAHHNYVSADTKFEYLTFQCADQSDNCFIECHGHDVWFGKGLKMTDFRNLSTSHGNLDFHEIIPELSIILTATNLGPTDVEGYWTRTKPQTITIESGHYGRILGGRFTGGYFASSPTYAIQATAKNPSWAVINVNIDEANDDNKNAQVKFNIAYNYGGNSYNTSGLKNVSYTCDINCIVAGLTDGSIYGDYIINIHGGKIGYVVGANQGNGAINDRNGGKTISPAGGGSGKFGQWPNSSFFGRTIINVEQGAGMKPISINNLYAGGLGRNGDKTDAVVDMYLYGKTEINIKSGTIHGNVYGGGAGGVLGKNPWDPRVPYATTDANNTANVVYQGVQYGTWGSKTEGSPLVDVILHKPDGNGGFTTTTDTLNLGNSSTTINISGGNIGGNVYGGGDGFVSILPDKIAMQGIGSVFGTSTINITGGTIEGSIYGGSEGNSGFYGKRNVYGQTINHIAELNGTVNLNISGTAEKCPTIGGNIYGGGQGVASTNTEEYLRIATTGNSDLGDQYKTNVTVTIDLPEGHPFTGNIYGGGEMGTVDGNTKVVILNGEIEGSVFGGGKGELDHPSKAQVTGNASVKIGIE